MEILQEVDLFGILCTFKFFDKDKYHSIISISLSLILFITTIIFTYFFGLDFIFHEESKVLQSIRSRNIYEFYNLTMKDFFFAWKIEGHDNDAVNYTNILFPSINYFSRITRYYESIKFDKCKNFNLSFEIPNDIKEYYCTDLSKFSIGGGWENENNIEYFYLNIDMCNGQYCSSKEDFIKLLNIYGRLNIIIYYPTISFVPDEKVPYQITYNKKLISLDVNNVSVNRYYIRKYIFEEDNGWVFQKIKKNEVFGVSDIENYKEQNLVFKDDDLSYNYIFTANFYMDKKYSFHKRWFVKAFESLSIISAFYKALYVIFSLISSLCNNFLYIETIMLRFDDALGPNNFKTSTATNLNNNKCTNKNLLISNLINNSYNNRMEPSNLHLNIINVNKNSLNNININNINERKNILINKNEEKNKEKNLISLSNYINEENLSNNKVLLNKIDYYNNNDASNQFKTNNIYKLLIFHIFRCFLSKNKKLEYKKNLANKQTFLEKMDIYNYLILLKKVDLLSVIFKKLNSQNKYCKSI